MNLIISYKYLFMVLIKRPVVYSVEFHEDLFNIAIYTFLKFGSNFSRWKVYAKCENDDMVFEIDRFKSKSFIDGVKVDNQVFKVRNGYSIWVFDHFVLYPSMTGSLIHLLGRDKLNEAPDATII